MGVHVEHNDGHAVVHAQRDGGGVHHFQALMQHVSISNFLKKFGVGDLLGIGIVNSIHAGGLQNHVGLHFHGAQGGGGVRGKIRIASAGGKNHNATLLEMPVGATADERFGDLLHFDGA